MIPPHGYQLIENGEIKKGDLFWSFNSNAWMPVFDGNIGIEIAESVRVCRPESNISDGDAMTGYFAFTDDSCGDYRAVEFYGDQQPSHDELMELAEQMGKKIVLIQGQIIDEVESND